MCLLACVLEWSELISMFIAFLEIVCRTKSPDQLVELFDETNHILEFKLLNNVVEGAVEQHPSIVVYVTLVNKNRVNSKIKWEIQRQ